MLEASKYCMKKKTKDKHEMYSINRCILYFLIKQKESTQILKHKHTFSTCSYSKHCTVSLNSETSHSDSLKSDGGITEDTLNTFTVSLNRS